MAVKIFFCYAREDEELLKKLKAHLNPLQRQGLIDVWHDRDISAGEEWEKEINRHLKEAQIILLLVSPNFMNSEYCYSVEMKQAIERHEKEEARVIPIILDHVYWQIAPLIKLQALPTDGKPIMSARWHSLNEALYDVTEGVRIVVEELTVQLSVTRMLQGDNTELMDRWTERARKVLILGQKEQERFKHNYFGTEHLLLGLIRESEGVAAKVLSNLGVELSKVRSVVEIIIKPGNSMVPWIGLTTNAKQVISLSLDEARHMNHHYIGTEHLLLALVREGKGISGGVLQSFGVTVEAAREQTTKLLDSYGGSRY